MATWITLIAGGLLLVGVGLWLSMLRARMIAENRAEQAMLQRLRDGEGDG